ncbi:MAG: hypothetical protein JW395_1822 [Nitrospira sp.]|nr:hypothetical protein [Nitrospira sp.]
MEQIDGAGDTVQIFPTSTFDVYSSLGGQNALVGFNSVSGKLEEFATPNFVESGFSYLGLGFGGNLQKQGQPNACRQPPFASGWRNLDTGLTFTYRFDGNGWASSEQGEQERLNRITDTIVEGFGKWNVANEITDLNTRVVPSESTVRAINVVRKDLGLLQGKPVYGKSIVSEPVILNMVDGTLTHTLLHQHPAEIAFTNRENALYSNETHLKVALHELGHLLGVDDILTGAVKGRSVMNNFSAREKPPAQYLDDPLNWNPTEVIECDRLKVKDAATRSYP